MKKFVFLFSIFISVYGEKFLLAKDDTHQVEIYGPHTVVQSWIIDTYLYGLFMNSFLGVQTTKFLVATNVKPPYTIFQVNNILHVISTEDNGLAFMTLGKHSKTLDFETGRRIKFDYLTQNVYTLVNNSIIIRKYGSNKQIGEKCIGNVSDFYVQDDKITVCPNEQCRELEIKNNKNFVGVTPIHLLILVCMTALVWPTYYILKIYIIPIYKNDLQILRR